MTSLSQCRRTSAHDAESCRAAERVYPRTPERKPRAPRFAILCVPVTEFRYAVNQFDVVAQLGPIDQPRFDEPAAAAAPLMPKRAVSMARSRPGATRARRLAAARA